MKTPGRRFGFEWNCMANPFSFDRSARIESEIRRWMETIACSIVHCVTRLRSGLPDEVEWPRSIHEC